MEKQIIKVKIDDDFQQQLKESKQMTIFFDKEKTRRQIIRPNDTFDGKWFELAKAIAGNGFHHYEVN